MQMARRFRGRGTWQPQLMKLKGVILELAMLAVAPYASGQAPVPSVIACGARLWRRDKLSSDSAGKHGAGQYDRRLRPAWRPVTPGNDH